MQMTHYDIINFRPHPVQFVINELPLMSVCVTGLIYGGMEICLSAAWRQQYLY